MLDMFRRRANTEIHDQKLRDHFKNLKPRSDAQFKAREFLSTPKKKVRQAPKTQPLPRRVILPELVPKESRRPERAASPPPHQPDHFRLPSLPNGKTFHPRGNRPHQPPAIGVRPREARSLEEYTRPLTRTRSLPPIPGLNHIVRTG